MIFYAKKITPIATFNWNLSLIHYQPLIHSGSRIIIRAYSEPKFFIKWFFSFS